MTSPALSPSPPRGKASGLSRRSLAGRREALDSDQFATRLHEDRTLRVAANFCETQDEAVWLSQRLRSHPRLSTEQVMLLKPVDAIPRRFEQLRLTWDAMRPYAQRSTLATSGRALHATELLGMVLGLGLSLLANLSMPETLAATALILLLTVGIGRVLRPMTRGTARPRRFDQVLQQRLAHGQYAVVVAGVRDASTASDAIDAMRSVGVYWCAETPKKAE